MPVTHDIRIRDPFVLVRPEEGAYYLYGTTDADPWHGSGGGFDCYRSTDLIHWEDPTPAFRPPAGFWADTQFWAPEVHADDGRLVMLATFSRGGRQRGTQALLADAPAGPFRPVGDGPLTPAGWSCLDGTLYREGERLWMVYCHEWTQIGDGAVVAQRVSGDLTSTTAEPIVLFHGSEAPWSRPIEGGAHLTDGPFLLRTTEGTLLMLWSSQGAQGYAMGVARSSSGLVTGPWSHDPEPLWHRDGGHGMVFRDLDGRSWLALHQPNTHTEERLVLRPLVEHGGRLSVAPDPNGVA